MSGGTRRPATLPRVTWPRVIAFRARRHRLHERAPTGALLDVVSELCGLHAQLLSSAELSAWARVEGLARTAVTDALWEDRTLVKTWAMRGTLHLLTTADYPLYQAALSTYDHYLKAAWYRGFDIAPAELDALLAEVPRALQKGPLTRDALARTVAERTGSAELGEKLRESWGGYLKPVAFTGGLCFGPDDGRHVQFAHPERWLGAWAACDARGAVAEVARRFLRCHGPATREDYARWWGARPAPAEQVLASLGDVVQVEVEGDRHWLLAEDVEPLLGAEPVSSVRLLPGFDPYVSAMTKQAARFMPSDAKARVHRPQGWISAVLVVAGRIVGVWRHERKGQRLVVTIEPFEPVRARTRAAAEDEAAGLAAFLGAELEVSWS